MKDRYNIGDYVQCKARCVFGYDNNGRKNMSRVPESFNGWIVGVVNRREGRYIEGSYGDWDGFNSYQGPATFKVTKNYKLWKVATSLTTKPLEVLIEDIEPCNSTPCQTPYR